MSDPITLKVNGQERQITVRPADTLLYALRLQLLNWEGLDVEVKHSRP